jgi:putative ABC transport system permease protein
LQDKVAGQTWVWTLIGLGLLLMAAICAWVSLTTGIAWISFGSALTTLLGFSLFVPLACRILTRILLWFSQAGGRDRVFLRLATGQFSRSLHRNAVTIAAMVTSLAMVVGISTMIYSFRTTVELWLNRSIQADLLIAPAANLVLGNRELVRPDAEHALDELARKWNAQYPGTRTAKVDKFRELRLRLGSDGDEVKLVTYHMKITRGMGRLSYIQGDEESAIGGAIDHEGTVISEALSRKHHLNVGDFVEVNTPAGRKAFKIGGVYRDYTTEFGVMLLDWDTYHKYWQDDGINVLAVYLPPGADLQQSQQGLEDTLRPFGDYMVKSNRELRTQVFLIFDQTFSVTYVLQIIGVIVSTLGIFLSLTILVTERRREISILRATGASQAQITQLILIEAGMIGVVGSVLGLMAGLTLAKILSDVVNVAFFGWTITWATPWVFLMLLPPVVIASSLLAGYGPARQAARLNIANGLKME